MQYLEGYYWPDNVTPKDVKFLLQRKHHAFGVLPYCKKFGTLVQAGGNVGIYPIIQSSYFNKVLTFEPFEYLYQCLSGNIAEYPKVHAYPVALSSICGTQLFSQKSYSTGRVALTGLPLECITLDSLNLDSCDAIQLDVEGHEQHVLLGAWNTITKYRPVIQLEVPKGAKQYHALDPCHKMLTDIGYSVVREIGKDTVYAPL